MDFQRKQFTFYQSFYTAMLPLPKKKRGEAALMLIEYALYGTEPDTNDPTLLMFLESNRPSLDKARTRAFAGAVGGSKSKNKSEANDNQTESKIEANDNQTESKAEASNSLRNSFSNSFSFSYSEEGKAQANRPAAPQSEEAKACWKYLTDSGIRYLEKNREEVEEAAEKHGYAEIVKATERALYMGKNTWAYIRGILNSGGVNPGPRDKNHYQKHGEPLSPEMAAAVKRMLEQEDFAP